MSAHSTIQKKLVLAGSGIKTISHITNEVMAAVISADLVLYLLNEPISEQWIIKHAKNAVSLSEIYFSYDKRVAAYDAIADEIVRNFNEYNNICVVFYGHPTIFAAPGIKAIQIAESIGIQCSILPAVSADGCLFADLKIDPGKGGCFSIDATELLLYQRPIDSKSHVILWQIGLIGNFEKPSKGFNQKALDLLIEHLLTYYDEKTQAVLYEAALYPRIAPKLIEFNLPDLSKQALSPISTLYIPPLANDVRAKQTILQKLAAL